MRKAKKFVRYLKESMHIALIYDQKTIGQLSKGGFKLPPPFRLVGYADSNFAGDFKDHKSVMGYCFFIGDVLVFWSSKKQRSISTLTNEAEYIALGHASREEVWMYCFLNEMALGEKLTMELMINGDNKSSLLLVKNPKAQNQTKHINVQYYYIRGLINKK